MRKYKHAEERHMYYKAEWRKIYKAKEESENVRFFLNTSLAP